jgi:hypothetical protein
MPIYQIDPVPNFVIVGEAGRSIFDFPQPEEDSSTQPGQSEVDNSENGTLTSASIPNTRPGYRQGKRKGEVNINPGVDTDKRAIKFRDAIDRKFGLPFNLCRTWAVSIYNFLSRQMLLTLFRAWRN